MSRRLTRPYFPVPPADYNQRYFSEVIRSFSVFLAQVQNPGDLRATTLTLTDLQSNDVGLEPGALFQQNGFVKVTLINAPNPSGVGTTTGVGAVTVVTT